MKKIILAVASVLALGLFASCQREISGDLTVTQTSYNGYESSLSRRYVYTATGTITQSGKTTTYNAKPTAATLETIATINEWADTYEFGQKANVVELQVSQDKRTNVITYTYTFPNLKKSTTWTNTAKSSTPGVADIVTKGKNVELENSDWRTIVIRKADSKYFYNSKTGWVEVTGINPEAGTVDLSKIADTAQNDTTLTSATYNATTGDLETYTGKSVVENTATTFALTLTRK